MSQLTVGVVYDLGGTPLEIARGLESIADLIFVAQDSPHTRSVRALLEQLAPVVDFTTAADTAAALRDRIDAIVTFSEPALETTTAVGNELGLPTHSVETVAWATDKNRQRRRLRECGVDSLWCLGVQDRDELVSIAERLPFPVVVKPRKGGASRAVYRLDTPSDITTYVTAFEDQPEEPLHVEELIEGRANEPFGDLISVETATFRGETRLIHLTGNFRQIPPFRETGHVWPATTTYDEQITALETTLAAIDALDIDNGITHTEFKLTAGAPRLIEVNARLGGFINAMTASDPNGDLFAAAALIALGREPWGVLPTVFEPWTFVFMQEPPLKARVLRETSAGGATRRMAKQYKPLHPTPATLRTDLGTEWLDAFVSVAPDTNTMFARLRDHVAATRFQFVFDDDRVVELTGAELPSAQVLQCQEVVVT